MTFCWDERLILCFTAVDHGYYRVRWGEAHSRGRPQEEHPDGHPLLVRVLRTSLRPGGTQGGITWPWLTACPHPPHSSTPHPGGGGLPMMLTRLLRQTDALTCVSEEEGSTMESGPACRRWDGLLGAGQWPTPRRLVNDRSRLGPTDADVCPLLWKTFAEFGFCFKREKRKNLQVATCVPLS